MKAWIKYNPNFFTSPTPVHAKYCNISSPSPNLICLLTNNRMSQHNLELYFICHVFFNPLAISSLLSCRKNTQQGQNPIFSSSQGPLHENHQTHELSKYFHKSTGVLLQRHLL